MSNHPPVTASSALLAVVVVVVVVVVAPGQHSRHMASRGTCGARTGLPFPRQYAIGCCFPTLNYIDPEAFCWSYRGASVLGRVHTREAYSSRTWEELALCMYVHMWTR
ncbi:hypothetical protein GQ43DRAFT_1317 [Delitschia confertaspora ATCC 74209]|uniref:Uncharacterized protein n=1 Tax=Delitschia confertaspora ATCC 74209 TaxID=1513339 RepID=A0A9P4JUI4_9PLEO|nr:hypothetical protein GQ43DRAFT_1317 [Delitschia confertaspora ATCC 74209]